uniref:Uncharacterized protein n=1 Tax=Cucumis melo TaxID=3656 RepID=A0A9I9E7M4_CUCME
MDVVHRFYDAKFDQSDLFITTEGKKVYFNFEAINELYDLPNDVEYPGQDIIIKPTRGLVREALKIIMWPNIE